VLREGIISGRFPPGSKLDYSALAGQLEMSPMPIREAIRQLHALGLVELSAHRGARVTELSVEDLREVYATRFPLEGWAVWEAATRFGPAAEEHAEAALERTVEAEHRNDHLGSWLADSEFHFAVYVAAGSDWLVRAITPLWETCERYRRISQSPARDFTERHVEHRAILDACVAHNSELAARRLGEHLARSANRLADALAGIELFTADEPLLLPLPRKR